METALKISPRSRIATAGALNHIRFSMFQLAGTGELNPLGRRWLFFLVSLVRMGYSEIRASMYDITRAQYRSQGQTSSQSTAYRGLKLMERAGFIRRQRYRVGPDRFRVIVHINVECFGQWLTDTPHIQGVTPDHINTQLSKCERTQDPDQGSHVPPPTLTDLSVNKHPRVTSSKEHLIKKTLERGRGEHPERREHPIVYSLRMATAGHGKKRRALILALARKEAKAPQSARSGADWGMWCERNQHTGRIRFEDLSIPHEREAVVLEQFLPYLEQMAGIEKVAKPVISILTSSPSPEQLDREQEANRARVQALRAEIENPIDPDNPPATADDLRALTRGTPFDQSEPESPSKQEVADMLQGAGLVSALRIDPGAPGEVSEKPPVLDSLVRRELEQLKSKVEQARANLGIAPRPVCTSSKQ